MSELNRELVLVLGEVYWVRKHLQNLLFGVVAIEELKMGDSLNVDFKNLINLLVTKKISIVL